MKTCEQCGERFRPKHGAEKYCNECRLKRAAAWSADYFERFDGLRDCKKEDLSFVMAERARIRREDAAGSACMWSSLDSGYASRIA
jgi:hypothetical protein